MAALQVLELAVGPLVTPAGQDVSVNGLRALGEVVLEVSRPDIGNVEGGDGPGPRTFSADRALLALREVTRECRAVGVPPCFAQRRRLQRYRGASASEVSPSRAVAGRDGVAL
jgi:hypothetical protein